MTARLMQLLTDLGRIAEFDARRRRELIGGCQWVRQATTQEIQDLLPALLQVTPSVEAGGREPLTALLGHLATRLRAIAGPSTEQPLWPDLRAQVVQLYRRWGTSSEGRHQLLATLAAFGEVPDLVEFAELIATDPPADGNLAVLAFAPLFQHPPDAIAALFPRLLDALQHVSVAAPVIDLANFVTRRHLVPRHPGSDRTEQLATLLGSLVQRLGLFEQRVQAGEVSAEEMAADRSQVAESLALTVALCDALALIGDPSVIGKLYQAMEVAHRQVRTEAASALARLGDKTGRETLLAMASEPVARLRVLAYAEELGMLDEVAQQYRSPVARAEAELVLWLAEPAQFGFPPQQVDLIDSRRQYWPGYDEPVDCFLFRYVYRLPLGELSNVGIAGPVVHGMTADFTELPVEDVYAAFAGWHAEHDDLVEYEVDELPAARAAEAESIRTRISAAGYDSLQVRRFGLFFDQLVLIATAIYNGVFGSVIADKERSYWCPQTEAPASLGPDDAYHLYKGRKLLDAFNG
jgi:hypothetical protein